ncbi:MAG TPA: hypothetical protein VGN72_01215 [Tepidisphaeraceae bacterium]|nr:hypothetical protein [Tepidisphaeraceae bacterium]
MMRRKLVTKTTGARGEALKADDFVIALVDRLIKTERRLEEVQRQLDEHMEMISEIQPKLTPEGFVTLRAMNVDKAEETIVTIIPAITQKEQQ